MKERKKEKRKKEIKKKERKKKRKKERKKEKKETKKVRYCTYLRPEIWKYKPDSLSGEGRSPVPTERGLLFT